MIDESRVTLRSGERVALAAIEAPEPGWAARIVAMLQHKGEPWNWQNAELLRQPSALRARFYVLHRQGAPFSHVMTMVHGGVGLLGHVWTEPADRRAGASSILMERALADFRRDGGRALYLITDYDRPPWHYYHRRGFEPIQPRGNTMGLFPGGRAAFETEWFAATSARIEPLDWAHWPATAPLLLGDFPGQVRVASARAIGRCSSEDTLLPLIQEQRKRTKEAARPVAVVLRDERGPAVLGIASCRPDPIWAGTEVLDVFVHPAWWSRAGEMLAALQIPAGQRLIAYADAEDGQRRRVLEAAGLRPVGVMPKWILRTAAGERELSVGIFCRA